MYLKLALRNAKRSIFDYILYIFSMVMLTSIICLSTSIANWGDVQAGFQTMALPLLIAIIMATNPPTSPYSLQMGWWEMPVWYGGTICASCLFTVVRNEKRYTILGVSK